MKVSFCITYNIRIWQQVLISPLYQSNIANLFFQMLPCCSGKFIGITNEISPRLTCIGSGYLQFGYIADKAIANGGVQIHIPIESVPPTISFPNVNNLTCMIGGVGCHICYFRTPFHNLFLRCVFGQSFPFGLNTIQFF